jgi:hypothetical protein
VGYQQLNNDYEGVSAVVVTQGQFDVISNYRKARAAREGRKAIDQPTDQYTDQLEALAHDTLFEIFKDGFPDWFPVSIIGGASNAGNASNANTNVNAHPSTSASTMAIPSPSADHVEQPPPAEPSLFNPESAHEYAEALENRLPVLNQEDELQFNDFDAVADPLLAEPSLTSAAGPVSNDLVPPSSHVSVPSGLETAEDFHLYLNSLLEKSDLLYSKGTF